jgi:hypothetical protein
MIEKVLKDSSNGCSYNMDIIMGTLKPSATLIYERVDGVVYARESGQTERTVVGYEFDQRTPDGRSLHDHLKESKLWGNIHRAAKTNPALQEALDRAIIIYKLSQADE